MSVNGLNIKKLRQSAGIRQGELAKRIGVTQGMVSQLENGARSCRIDTLEKLAEELRCSVEELSGKQAIWISFVRNCKRLSEQQLSAVNDIVMLIVGQEASKSKHS